ncbi:hypothetical protein [Pontimicrobium sp. IMCC45349]|uniref:hypothetical protein n=1 Tax=Pontimicrobium sp. IMCC45349 TaxID=3391574 RepID=UPI00399F88AF
MKSIKNAVLLALIIFSFSCNDEELNTNTPPQGNDPDPTTFSQNFGNEISRNFLGTVVDKNNNPIENVTITVGSSIASTDSNGVFIINNANVNERFAYIKASKAGYIHGSRAVVPSSGTNKVTIMLLDETVIGTTNSGSQETFNLDNGASVSLEGEYIKEDGTAYSGSVDVIMHHLDPEDENMSNQMPGMLYAANSQNEERMLQTYGMLAVELRGSGGEDINLAEGSTAEIRVPLATNLVASAPATIPLWYFDETHGYWIEDGQANLVGNEYVGTVTHFSFWNYDAQFPAVNLCINVVDENDNPISNLSITLTHSNSDYLYPTSSGYTNENGEVCGLVPSNETLELNAYSYDACGSNTIYTSNIGPFSTDSTITIMIPIQDNPEIITETITGNFNDCNSNPVIDGYVNLTYGNQSYIDIVDDGNFEITLIRCAGDDTFQISGADYTNLQTTGEINYTFTTPTTNIGTITSCNDVTEFIQFTIDGVEEHLIIEWIDAYFGENGQTTDFSLNIYAQTNDNFGCFFLFGSLNDAPYIGTYDHLDWNTPGDTGMTIQECNDIADENNNIIYNLTAIGDVGEYIDINFSGDYQDFQGNTHTITGVIHVLRDE